MNYHVLSCHVAASGDQGFTITHTYPTVISCWWIIAVSEQRYLVGSCDWSVEICYQGLVSNPKNKDNITDSSASF